ncbi:hypothetical protein V2J09_023773, partial [Rumex salicifolius]
GRHVIEPKTPGVKVETKVNSRLYKKRQSWKTQINSDSPKTYSLGYTMGATQSGPSQSGSSGPQSTSAENITNIKQQEDWEREKKKLFIQDKNSTEKPELFNTLVVVEFSAQWCGPSRFISPFIDKLAEVFKDVWFLRLDYDSMEDAASEVGVDVVPTFLLYKEGQLKEKIVGARRFDLFAKINELK